MRADASDLKVIPPAVRQVIEQRLGGTLIQEIVTRTECASTLYEVHYTFGRAWGRIKVTENGEEVSDEAAVPVEELPACVIDQIEKNFGRGVIVKADRMSVTFYEVEIAGSDGRCQISISPTGEILAEEDD